MQSVGAVEGQRFTIRLERSLTQPKSLSGVTAEFPEDNALWTWRQGYLQNPELDSYQHARPGSESHTQVISVLKNISNICVQ